MEEIVIKLVVEVFWLIKRFASIDEALSFNRLFDSINLVKTIPLLEDKVDVYMHRSELDLVWQFPVAVRGYK